MEGEVLRDDQWERLRDFVPGGRRGRRGPRSDGRRFFDAILWLAHSGGRWRDMPDRFGPYQTESDVLTVTRLDRLARSTADLLGIVAKLEAKGVGLRVLDFGGSEIDTKSSTGRLLLTVIAAVAEAERSMMPDRQRCGIAKAKSEGRYKGRAPTARAKAPQAREMRASGVGPSAIAAKLSISRASVYRILAGAAA